MGSCVPAADVHAQSTAGLTRESGGFKSQGDLGLSCAVSSFRADHVHLDSDESDYY